MKPKLIIILGATGVGKSEIALELAEAIGGEIVNADSQQVYRHLEIGTGKPSKTDRDRVPHHVIDVVNPDEEFNVAAYRRLAVGSIDNIERRDRKILVCGGTGLYIKALTEGLFTGPAASQEIREELRSEIEGRGLASVFARLQIIDPAATSWIHPNDRQRIIRALEVFALTGKSISEWQREHGFSEHCFETLKIGLNRPREELYGLINRRCDRMIDEGLVDEVKNLIAMGYELTLPPLGSVGYRHVGLFLTGVMPLDDAVALMKRDTRRLAKRQLTWFRRDKEIHWRHPDKDRRNIAQMAKEFLADLA
jgi:tRNA dimethylallyltransferase